MENDVIMIEGAANQIPEPDFVKRSNSRMGRRGK